MHQLIIFNIANMSFNIIGKNKNLAKISQFTVYESSEKNLLSIVSPGPEVIKLFMLNLTEHQASTAHKN